MSPEFRAGERADESGPLEDWELEIAIRSCFPKSTESAALPRQPRPSSHADGGGAGSVAQSNSNANQEDSHGSNS